jgi:D-amino-acid dehydrogenase
MAKTVIVIGGGVIGLSCAYALTEAGCDVVVVDAGAVAGGASKGNAGWITPSLATPLAAPGILTSGLRSALDPRGALVIRPSLDTAWLRWLWSFRRAARPEQFSAGIKALLEMTRRTLEELDAYRAAGIQFEMHADGIIAVARDRSAFHWFDDTFAELARYGFEGDLVHLDGDQARAAEPALGDAVGAATRMTIDRHVDPESLVRGLATRVGRVLEDAPVTAIASTGAGWRVRAGAESLVAEAVVARRATPSLRGDRARRRPARSISASRSSVCRRSSRACASPASSSSGAPTATCIPRGSGSSSTTRCRTCATGDRSPAGRRPAGPGSGRRRPTACR